MYSCQYGWDTVEVQSSTARVICKYTISKETSFSELFEEVIMPPPEKVLHFITIIIPTPIFFLV